MSRGAVMPTWLRASMFFSIPSSVSAKMPAGLSISGRCTLLKKTSFAIVRPVPLIHAACMVKALAAPALDLHVHFSLFENEADAFADYVLPVASGVEKDGISRASEERRIVWSDKLIDPPGEARSDGWIWIEPG